MKGFARKKHSKNDSFDKSCISDRAHRQAGKLNNQIFINLRVRTFNFDRKFEKEFQRGFKYLSFNYSESSVRREFCPTIKFQAQHIFHIIY